VARIPNLDDGCVEWSRGVGAPITISGRGVQSVPFGALDEGPY